MRRESAPEDDGGSCEGIADDLACNQREGKKIRSLADEEKQQTPGAGVSGGSDATAIHERLSRQSRQEASKPFVSHHLSAATSEECALPKGGGGLDPRPIPQDPKGGGVWHIPRNR